jgi:hypothetical protein
MNRTSEKPIADGNALRMLLCRGPGCGAMFFVCIGCYRGQRYCCEACRETARRIQMRAANARYQRSNAGKALAPIAAKGLQDAPFHEERDVSRLHISRGATTYPTDRTTHLLRLWPSDRGWINPYAAIARVALRRPRKPQQRNRSATVRIYTFSNDR